MELLALKQGFSVDRVQKDYGYDLIVSTYSSLGFIENGSVLIQLKATDAARLLLSQKNWPLRVQTADLALWLREPYPVILVYYHAGRGAARWLYVQRDLKAITWNATQKTKTVQLPKDQKLYSSTFSQFAAFKAKVLSQAGGVITHD